MLLQCVQRTTCMDESQHGVHFGIQGNQGRRNSRSTVVQTARGSKSSGSRSRLPSGLCLWNILSSSDVYSILSQNS